MALIRLNSYSIPADNLADGNGYEIRYWYNFGFIDSAGQPVQSGTATTGTQIRGAASVANGFLIAEDVQIYTTVNAQGPFPQSINLSCQVFKGDSALPIYPFRQQGCPSSWIIYDPSPDDFWELNSLTFLQQASYPAYQQQWMVTNQEMIDYVNSLVFLKATALVYGITRLSLDPDAPGEPIAVGDNDPRLVGLPVADASTTVKGIGKVSVAPVDADEPIFVGDNDTRMPTQTQADALVGTNGTPSTSNPYVTDSDPRLGSSRVVYASKTCVLDSNVITGGGTDDTLALQALLDLAQTDPLNLIMDGAALTGPLSVYGNTTIYCINSSCGFYLADNSDLTLIRNANPSTGAITDKNIAYIGGTYNGNSVNQTGIGQFNTQEPDGTVIGLIQTYGVSNFIAHDLRLIHSKTVALHLSNVQNFDINDIFFDNDVGGQFQQGGLQMEGLCRDGTVNNMRGTTQDDFVSLSSDGALWPNPPFTGLGPYVVAGDIQNIIIKGLAGVSGTSACRLFNGIYRIDNIIVDGVTGTWTRVFLNDPDIMALNGNVGTIVLANVVVGEVTGLITSPIEVTGKMDHFIVRNFNINDPVDNRPIVNIKEGTNIKLLEIDGFNISDTDASVTTMTPIHVKGRVQRLVLNNVKWLRDENLAFPASATQAFVKMDNVLSSIQDLIINGVVMNRVPYFIYYQLGFLENVKLSNTQLDDTVGGAGFRTDVSVDSPLTDVSVSNWFGQMAPAFFGLAQPTRLRGDCYARDTTPPTFVSASCNGGTDIVSVIFSESMNGINLYLGVTIKKNTVAQTLLAGLVSVESDSIVNYQLDANIAPGDTVTWEYVAADGFTIDWSNNPLANVGAQSVTNANTTRVFDRFTAVDGTALNGRTPSPTTAGNNWVTAQGSAALQTIISNHARLNAPFVAADPVDIQNGTSQSLTNNSTFADAIITADVRFTDVNGTVGLVFRFTDTNNFYAFTISSIATILWKVSGGVAASGTLPRYHGPDLFYRIKVIMAGNVITATVNGAELITTTDAFNNTATKHGIYASQGPGYIDNFLVVTP